MFNIDIINIFLKFHFVFRRHVQFKTDAYYGEGTGDILITNLDCAGFEVTIQSCYGFPNSEYPYNCFHDQDVGISCSDGKLIFPP